MILEQHYLACLAQASYLIGDERSGIAAVVDPRRDVELYLERARELGLEIRHVFLTHFHADFLAGHLELQARTGAVIHLGARAQAEYPFERMRDGAHLDLGSVRFEFRETPGHTPESVCIVVYDRTRDERRPHAVFTGDTLFIGDVGRPDLLTSVGHGAEELAGWLFDSLHSKLLTLPDETLVYPGHGAGSACGKNLSSDTVSTIGAQRRSNWALQPMRRAEFVRELTADQPPAPAYFAHDAELNKRHRPTLEESLAQSLRALSLPEVLSLVSRGAQVLDARDADDFGAGHLLGSTNVGLGGKYASWAGALLDVARPIVIVAEVGREREAALRLGRIGFDHVAGYLDDGPNALRARPDLVRRVPRLSNEDLLRALGAPEPPLVVDVRAASEHQAGHLPDARNLPLPQLRARAEELPRDRPLVLTCQSGYRSMIAASLLRELGFERISDHRGGFAAWSAAGLEVPAR